MLTPSERKFTSLIFWILFFIFAACIIGSYVAVGAIVIYTVQSAIMYTRIAKEDWRYTAGLRAQFVRSQKYYWLYMRRIFAPAAMDADEQFLNTYGGGQSIRQRLWEWNKRFLRCFSALLVWLPAMIIHGCFLGAASLVIHDE